MIDRDLLARLADGPISGNALASALGLTRSAVWKRIEGLRAAGIDVRAESGRGYRLLAPVEWLDAGRLIAGLSPVARAQLADLRIWPETASTNALALAEAPAARACRVYLAERQTAGRGRRGRSWASPLAANLYLTLSRRFEGGVAALQGLALAVGVAAAEALHAGGFPQVRLKWPNDLWVEGRKLGGILIEIGGEMSGPVQAAIGLGVNVRMPPATAAQIDQPWCDLASLTEVGIVSRQAVAGALLEHLLPALAQFQAEGLTPFLGRWRALDAMVDEPVRIIDGATTYEGIARGIDTVGALRLETSTGERRFHGGEVSLRSAGKPARGDRAGAEKARAS